MENIIKDLKAELSRVKDAEYKHIVINEEVAKKIVEALEGREWIETKEVNPIFGVPVLVYCKIYGRFISTYRYIGSFEGEKYGNWEDMNGKLGILPPTHWKPLPTPPQTKEGEG